jgi:hypothetical protein
VNAFWDSEGELAGFGKDYLVFERDAKVFTHLVGCSGVSEVSSRWV